MLRKLGKTSITGNHGVLVEATAAARAGAAAAAARAARDPNPISNPSLERNSNLRSPGGSQEFFRRFKMTLREFCGEQ